jgi:hypothetical protein
MQWRETAGELSYLSIRLLDFVAALPTLTLPPRGRVPWSTAELTELSRLTRVLVCGELDADRATESMGAIDDVFQRPHSQMGPGDAVAEAALLKGYIAHRHIAMLSLPRLQRLGDGQPGATPTVHTEPRLSWWRAAIQAFRHRGGTR